MINTRQGHMEIFRIIAQEVLWQKDIRSSTQDFLSQVTTTIDQQYLITGSSIQSDKLQQGSRQNNGYDFHLVKLNQMGEEVWEKYFSGNNHDYLSSTVTTQESGFLISGTSYSGKGLDKKEESKGGSDIWLIRINEFGDELWQKTLGTSSDEEARAVVQTTDLGFFVAGNVQNSSKGYGSKDAWVIRLDKDGKVLSEMILGGKGLDDFRESMLGDERIALLHDYLNPEQVFPKTNIRGGICYFLWDESYDNNVRLTKVVTHKENEEPISVMRSLKSGDSDIFIRHEIALQIFEKIKNDKGFKSFSKYVSPLRPFGFRGYFTNDEKFRSESQGLNSPVICYGKGKKMGYVEKNEVTIRKGWIDRFKVFTPRANNIGTELNDDNLNTFIGEPGTICTESYLVMGAELKLNKETAESLCKYISTKFLRFMHSLAKSSQDATSKTYKFVPLQDYTSDSDIDWNKSIPEIDQQLYRKYKLTDEEIAFIERMIKPMVG